MFGLRAEVLSFGQPEVDSLTRFGFFCGLDELNMRILHHAPLNWHGKMTDYLRNINGLNFADLIGYGAFGVEDSKKIARPEFPDCSKEVEALFRRHNLVEGKTVLLSPYAYTFRYNLPDYMWEKIAARLQDKGYTVCTNVSGPSERPVWGTTGLYLEYRMLRSFLERAGYFIGLRSGFCEVVSSIRCKKIIIYQPFLWWNDGTHLEYFSMNTMGLCDDAIELEFRGRIDYLDLLQRVEGAVLGQNQGAAEK